MLVEGITHSLDTINMRAKVINGPKVFVFELIKNEGIFTLLKGFQPIMYGYIISSFVYFYFYANLKSYIQNNFMHAEKSINSNIEGEH